MKRFCGLALQGSSRGLLSPLLLLIVLLITTSGISAHAADDTTACRFPFARVVSLQGSVELQRAGQSGWSELTRLDTPLCQGDRLRAGALSRAALFLQPETLVRVDQNTLVTLSQTAEETLVEFFQEDIVPVSGSAHACGAGYFITRFPRKFKVNTPHLNAAVEGTEFLVAMRCESTELSVFEGKVLAASTGTDVFPSQTISSGQTLTVGGREPPAIKLLLKPADAVQWTLYYPPITPAGALPVEDCRVVALDNRVSCLIARAEQLLRAGRVEEARVQIGDALAAAPYSSDAKALSSIISLARNDKAEALRLAREAVEATAGSAPAWLALSYAQQAGFELEAALTSAQRAAELTPSSALALARVAELQLSLGWTREAEKTARRAVAANPSESRAHMILGFVHLAQINVKQAREDFGRAIESDSTEPLSRLGLGLAIIREGKLVEGREQIEIAVALDPTNSLLRSYVGKAYYEENTKERDELASTQFGLAKQLDPNDPTPWFYDAVRKALGNQPVPALDDVLGSIWRNDNRAVFRSRLSLDQDLAARGTALAQVFSGLGFDQRALIEGTRAVASDPSSFSAHHFLADAYSAIPRHEVARQSELLQSQIRQPLIRGPVQPALTEDRLLSLRDISPQGEGANELSTLFTSSGVGVFASAVVGDNDTTGSQLALSALGSDSAMSIGRLTYSTEGFRENNEFAKDVLNLFLQKQISWNSSLQFEARHSDTRQGDTVLRFDPALFSPTDDQILSDSIRLGARHRLGANADVVASLMSIDSSEAVSISGFTLVELTFHTQVMELQTMYVGSDFNLVGGVGYYTEERKVEDFLGNTTSGRPDADSVYGYATLRPYRGPLSIQLGLSADHIDGADAATEAKSALNPKAGFVWDLPSGTIIRGAVFRTLKRRFFSSQTLEPTQIAGFNQLYDDFDGTIGKRGAIGLDQILGSRAFAGIEFSRRNLTVSQEVTNEQFEWKERFHRAYAYWAPRDWLALSAGYEYERLERPPNFSGFELVVDATTHTVPLRVSLFTQAGFSTRVGVNHVRQYGRFFSSSLSPDPEPGSDRFWITEASISYRLPMRTALLSLEIHNLFDESFRFQETDILNTRYARQRTALFRFSVSL